MPPKVFISYHHAPPDEDLARNLYQFLSAKALQAYIDFAIPHGARWEAEIEARLEESDYCIVILSEQSVLSDMLREEVRRAHGRSRKNLTTLLPVWVGELSELPYDLAAWLNPIQRIRWRQGQGYPHLFASLLAAITGGGSLPLAGRGVPTSVESGALGAAVEEGAPLPAADPRPVLESGAVPLASRFYVRRRYDEEVEQQISLPIGRTIVIRGPRQSGKSSLLARARAFAATQNQRTVYLDFQAIDDDHLADAGKFMRSIGTALEREFATATRLSDLWDADLTGRENLRAFLQKAVLRGARVTLLLDEVDRVFHQPWRTGFFAELRHWHNLRATAGAPWDQLTLVLGHSTDPALWIDTDDQSPFNVADLSLWLEDFGAPELARLNELHGHPLADVNELRAVFGGHPYLARLAFYTLVKEGRSVAALAATAMEPKSPFSTHLRRHLLALQKQPALASAVRKIVRGEAFDDDAAFERLFSAGLMGGTSPREAAMRCQLYTRYFRERL
jgi:hypothetical protein